MSSPLIRSVRSLRRPILGAAGPFNCIGRPKRFNSSAPIIETPPAPGVSSPSLFHSPAASGAAAGSLLHKGNSAASGSTIAPERSLTALLPLLAAQPSHYITLHIHGKPYLVTPGDSIRLPFKMPGVLPGDVLRFDRASIIGSRDLTLKGSPWINQDYFECRAVVLGTDSEPMRLKIKKKQRERKTKTVKSKHKFTVLRISELKILAP